ncbi:MAG: cation:proton antiporter [Candidatus Pacebacteria bacterium]|nr:cation:proton antiporter [Candidatus Paceibacterota bacterium]
MDYVRRQVPDKHGMYNGHVRPRSWSILAVVMVMIVLVPSAGAAQLGAGASGVSERMTHLMLQLAVILCVAKTAGYASERFLRIPAVLGELASGVIIGPYALGSVIGLFEHPELTEFPLSPELYGIATLASIVLLYLAGLETDLGMFLRYSVAGSLVGAGGVILSFVLGDLAAVWTGLANSVVSPAALFLGTISTATSVGITARILSERNKLDSPEGVTVLAGAVIDDVLGIVILAAVIGMARVMERGGNVEWLPILAVLGKALGFWVICTAVGLLIARRLGKILETFRSRQTMASISLGLALLLAGLSEKAGLAMIIGAYIMGLSFSRVDCAHVLRRHLEPVYHTLVSVFFCVMGMMVDVNALQSILLVGIVFSLIAIVAKVLGCAVPAMFAGFNLLGASRIGFGMLPRGEVALIVAGIGLSTGLITSDIFGVAIMMTLVTTGVAPLVMVRLYDDREGLRQRWAAARREAGRRRSICLTLPNVEIAEFLLSNVLEMFEAEECYVHQVFPGETLFQVRKDDISITLRREGATITLSCGDIDCEFARLVLLEALASLVKVFEGVREFEQTTDLRSQLQLG